MGFLKKLREKWKRKRAAKKAIKQLNSEEEAEKQRKMNRQFRLRNAMDYKKAEDLRNKIYKERGFEKGDSVHTMIYKENEIPQQVESREELPRDIKKELEKMQIGAFVLGKGEIYINTPFGVKRVSTLDMKPSEVQEILDKTSSKNKKEREEAINKLVQLALR